MDKGNLTAQGLQLQGLQHWQGNASCALLLWQQTQKNSIINLLALVKLYYAMFKAYLPLCKTIPNPLQTRPNCLATQKRWHS